MSGFVWTWRKSWEVSATVSEGNICMRITVGMRLQSTQGRERAGTEIQPLQEQSRIGLQCR